MIYVDTNILLYFHAKNTDPESIEHRKYLYVESLLNNEGTKLILSTNTLNEYTALLYKNDESRAKPKFTSEQVKKALSYIIDISENIYHPTEETIFHAIELRKHTKENAKAFYDALHIANAVESNAKVLYTEDKDYLLGINKGHLGKTIEGVKIVNPFADFVNP